jgi:fructoselysine 6-phosphate deglycase
VEPCWRPLRKGVNALLVTSSISRARVAVDPTPIEFQPTLDRAVALNDDIDAFVSRAAKQGLRNIYFVGCGGSLLAMDSTRFLLDRKATLPITVLNSSELIARRPALLGKGSLVVAASHSGNTPETVEAARLAREAGAIVLTVSRAASSPLAKAGHAPVAYASDVAVGEAKQIIFEQIGWSVLRHTGVDVDYAAIRAAFRALPQAMVTARVETDPRNHEIATRLKDEPITYVLGSGPNMGHAAVFAMCFLQEMQWLHAAACNAGEFFHGAFEVVTEDVAVILLLGEDESRPMAERAQRFLEKYTRKGISIDTRDLTLPGIDPTVRPEFASNGLATVVRRLANHYAAVRGHSLKQRRYMWTVDY